MNIIIISIVIIENSINFCSIANFSHKILAAADAHYYYHCYYYHIYLDMFVYYLEIIIITMMMLSGCATTLRTYHGPRHHFLFFIYISLNFFMLRPRCAVHKSMYNMNIISIILLSYFHISVCKENEATEYIMTLRFAAFYTPTANYNHPTSAHSTQFSRFFLFVSTSLHIVDADAWWRFI